MIAKAFLNGSVLGKFESIKRIESIERIYEVLTVVRRFQGLKPRGAGGGAALSSAVRTATICRLFAHCHTGTNCVIPGQQLKLL